MVLKLVRYYTHSISALTHRTNTHTRYRTPSVINLLPLTDITEHLEVIVEDAWEWQWDADRYGQVGESVREGGNVALSCGVSVWRLGVRWCEMV